MSVNRGLELNLTTRNKFNVTFIDGKHFNTAINAEN